jgi:hypothetical protein
MTSYEYSSINGTIDANFKKLEGNTISEMLTMEIAKTVEPKSFSQLQSQEWEIISHSLAPIENHLVISLLLRRLAH